MHYLVMWRTLSEDLPVFLCLTLPEAKAAARKLTTRKAEQTAAVIGVDLGTPAEVCIVPFIGSLPQPKITVRRFVAL